MGRSQQIIGIFDLQVPFSITQGHLALCTPPTASLPLEGFVRLYLLLPDRPVEIANLQQLRGYVRVDTPRAALAFVRLRTSPKTYYAFHSGRPREVEVITCSDVTSELMFGDRAQAERRRNVSNANGIEGIISPEAAKRLGVPAARCIVSGTGFETQRVLLVEERRFEPRYVERYHFVLSTEWVGRDGGYRQLQHLELHLPKRPALLWSIPMFR